MKPIRTETPSGEAIVILSAADYERLVAAAEDARDGMVADKALAEHRARPDDALSAADMSALLAAPTPLAFWRARRGLSLEGLADRARLLLEDMMAFEAGSRELSVATGVKLAEALDLSLDDLAA